ncbi:hypothetical protein [Nostoc flagelliforme]|uniref:hypothetical protein n=1 Tax=Nostoc flagelliforme TaxID=1306274 RepID=UPI0030D97B62
MGHFHPNRSVIFTNPNSHYIFGLTVFGVVRLIDDGCDDLAILCGMALRKEKIVEAAGVQRSGGAGEKEEVLGIAFGYLEIPLCTPAPLPLCNPYAAYSSA